MDPKQDSKFWPEPAVRCISQPGFRPNRFSKLPWVPRWTLIAALPCLASGPPHTRPLAAPSYCYAATPPPPQILHGRIPNLSIKPPHSSSPILPNPLLSPECHRARPRPQRHGPVRSRRPRVLPRQAPHRSRAQRHPPLAQKTRQHAPPPQASNVLAMRSPRAEHHGGDIEHHILQTDHCEAAPQD